ncbi:hypothetical protein PILCRDRAFT_421153 [Piloderma croceum F 1598]|uniref:TrmE-type G domain-containing protein n=1 Tax=Piloderma croceum (strain F 1598) TaxID=765440 RepID=A0A0C3G075_PILCF|nr:hypothetical protein PILCRDRAFT_421153 [Piloderma croceum F 1598]
MWRTSWTRHLSPTLLNHRHHLHRLPADLLKNDAQRSTIYALSTPPGKAGIAVVRVSGPDALHVWQSMVSPYSPPAKFHPEPWKMERCRITHPNTHQLLDDALAVFFKGPKSFTTQDVLELHIHSGRAIISSVLNALSQLPSCRPAEPGEFTRRAFQGGRLDLTQVEGLKDLIDAETEGQRRIALRTAGGTTRARFEELRGGIIKCLSLLEALIDFGEGEDIEEGVYDQARERAQNLHQIIHTHLSDNRKGEILRSGIRLTIFGPPNAGKSTLLNFLAQREAAIVTPLPGTTRDILELSLDIGGLPVVVADTAGLRHTDDVVESIGVERARNAVQESDISLCVLSLPEVIVSSPAGESLQIRIPQSLERLVTPETFLLLNKSDLAATPLASAVTVDGVSAKAWVASLSTGEGTKEFLDNFARALQERYDLFEDRDNDQAPLITHARHRTHLESALRFIEAFLDTRTS